MQIVVKTMAHTNTITSFVPVYSWLYAISKEIVPGPASIGIASGVNDIADRVAISIFTLRFSSPLCSLNFPVSNANPEEAMMSPPAILSETKLIPKNESMNWPRKKDNIRIMRTFIEARNAIRARAF